MPPASTRPGAARASAEEGLCREILRAAPPGVSRARPAAQPRPFGPRSSGFALLFGRDTFRVAALCAAFPPVFHLSRVSLRGRLGAEEAPHAAGLLPRHKTQRTPIGAEGPPGGRGKDRFWPRSGLEFTENMAEINAILPKLSTWLSTENARCKKCDSQDVIPSRREKKRKEKKRTQLC